ncbi:hypothetical protein HPB49_010059 [Dermacentor silvarum]|uniref:Uncharacterized protein n=1 Tax=Dermacentor silvarum TaxID=543639 RepID=A0ACB8DCH5_DERSI|nr:hypothetical protein HPB49_010059 [Dermacentor silvarum]
MASTTDRTPSLPAPRVRFTRADDLILLQVVNEIRPVCDPMRWQEVAKIVEAKTCKLCSARRVRERFDLLLIQFRRKDTTNRAKSGVEEAVGEWEELLQHISDLAREWGYKPRAVDRQMRDRKRPQSAAQSNATSSTAHTRTATAQSVRTLCAADMKARAMRAFAAASADADGGQSSIDDGADVSPAQSILNGLYGDGNADLDIENEDPGIHGLLEDFETSRPDSCLSAVADAADPDNGARDRSPSTICGHVTCGGNSPRASCVGEDANERIDRVVNGECERQFSEEN